MRMEATEMTKKRSDKKTAKKNSNNGKKSYSGIITDPYDRKITGRVYLKDDENYNVPKYGTLILIAVLAALAATLSPMGNALVSQFGFSYGNYLAL